MALDATAGKSTGASENNMTITVTHIIQQTRQTSLKTIGSPTPKTCNINAPISKATRKRGVKRERESQ